MKVPPQSQIRSYGLGDASLDMNKADKSDVRLFIPVSKCRAISGQSKTQPRSYSLVFQMAITV